MIVKLMKGDENFRTTTKSQIQFSNENYIYSNVVPAFKNILKNTEINLDNLIPRAYFAGSGSFPNLSDIFETVLAVKNVSPQGFRNGPRLHLELDHLKLMAKTIAQYHSVTYAMRIKKDPQLDVLIKGIKPLPFKEADGSRNLYDILYGVGMERIIEYLDRQPKDKEFSKNIENFKKFHKTPTDLLSKFLENDEIFSVITHGDFNRNNVLFQYSSPTGFANPSALNMIDFQEVRYGTPCIDLSFFMYFNLKPELREAHWKELLKYYHSHLIASLADILKCKPDDEILKDYFYENFDRHFTKFGMYGMMICIHFLPWMDCPEEECDRLSYLFENEIHSKEFWDLSILAGGDSTNFKIAEAMQHASKMGYMKIME